MENTSGQGSHAAVPKEIQGWNWGAFLLSWICEMKKFALLSLAMLFLLAFVPSEVRADGVTIRIESNAFALQDETA